MVTKLKVEGGNRNCFCLTVTEISHLMMALLNNFVQTSFNSFCDIKFLACTYVSCRRNGAYKSYTSPKYCAPDNPIGLTIHNHKKTSFRRCDCVFGDYDFTQCCKSTGLLFLLISIQALNFIKCTPTIGLPISPQINKGCNYL